MLLHSAGKGQSVETYAGEAFVFLFVCLFVEALTGDLTLETSYSQYSLARSQPLILP